MIYLIDSVTNRISGSRSNLSEDKKASLLLENPNFIFPVIAQVVSASKLHLYFYDPNTNSLKTNIDIALNPVGRSHINVTRDQLDESQVTMDGHIFDANQLSLRKMTDVANFMANDQEVTWTLADNTTYIFTGSAFKTIVDRVKKGQTKRSYFLHSHAKLLKERLPNVYESDLKQDLWPMDTTI